MGVGQEARVDTDGPPAIAHLFTSDAMSSWYPSDVTGFDSPVALVKDFSVAGSNGPSPLGRVLDAAAGDLDGDGLDETVLAQDGNPILLVEDNRRVNAHTVIHKHDGRPEQPEATGTAVEIAAFDRDAKAMGRPPHQFVFGTSGGHLSFRQLSPEGIYESRWVSFLGDYDIDGEAIAASIGALDAADVNGDGNQELLVSVDFHDGSGGGVLVFTVDWAAKTLTRHALPNLPKHSPETLTREGRFADVDGDGVLDVVVLQGTPFGDLEGSQAVQIDFHPLKDGGPDYRWDHGLNLRNEEGAKPGNWRGPISWDVGDVDGDGKDEIVALDTSRGTEGKLLIYGLKNGKLVREESTLFMESHDAWAFGDGHHLHDAVVRVLPHEHGGMWALVAYTEAFEPLAVSDPTTLAHRLQPFRITGPGIFCQGGPCVHAEDVRDFASPTTWFERVEEARLWYRPQTVLVPARSAADPAAFQGVDRDAPLPEAPPFLEAPFYLKGGPTAVAISHPGGSTHRFQNQTFDRAGGVGAASPRAWVELDKPHKEADYGLEDSMTPGPLVAAAAGDLQGDGQAMMALVTVDGNGEDPVSGNLHWFSEEAPGLQLMHYDGQKRLDLEQSVVYMGTSNTLPFSDAAFAVGPVREGSDHDQAVWGLGSTLRTYDHAVAGPSDDGRHAIDLNDAVFGGNMGPASVIRAVATGDLDGDGYDEIVVGFDYDKPNADYNNFDVVILEDRADGLHVVDKIATFVGKNNHDGAHVGDIGLGDFDGDGDVDIGVFHGQLRDGQWLEHHRIELLLNDGGGFVQAQGAPGCSIKAGYPSLAVTDMDVDGRDELYCVRADLDLQVHQFRLDGTDLIISKRFLATEDDAGNRDAFHDPYDPEDPEDNPKVRVRIDTIPRSTGLGDDLFIGYVDVRGGIHPSGGGCQFHGHRFFVTVATRHSADLGEASIDRVAASGQTPIGQSPWSCGANSAHQRFQQTWFLPDGPIVASGVFNDDFVMIQAADAPKVKRGAPNVVAIMMAPPTVAGTGQGSYRSMSAIDGWSTSTGESSSSGDGSSRGIGVSAKFGLKDPILDMGAEWEVGLEVTRQVMSETAQETTSTVSYSTADAFDLYGMAPAVMYASPVMATYTYEIVDAGEPRGIGDQLTFTYHHGKSMAVQEVDAFNARFGSAYAIDPGRLWHTGGDPSTYPRTDSAVESMCDTPPLMADDKKEVLAGQGNGQGYVYTFEKSRDSTTSESMTVDTSTSVTIAGTADLGPVEITESRSKGYYSTFTESKSWSEGSSKGYEMKAIVDNFESADLARETYFWSMFMCKTDLGSYSEPLPGLAGAVVRAQPWLVGFTVNGYTGAGPRTVIEESPVPLEPTRMDKTGQTPTFAWSAVDDATSYRIEVESTASSYEREWTTDRTTAQLNGLLQDHGETHRWRVTALNSDGESYPSPWQRFVPELRLNDPLRVLDPERQADGTWLVEWLAPSKGVDYTVHLVGEGVDETAERSDTRWFTPKLEPGTYEVTVVGTNDQGSSPEASAGINVPVPLSEARIEGLRRSDVLLHDPDTGTDEPSLRKGFPLVWDPQASFATYVVELTDGETEHRFLVDEASWMPQDIPAGDYDVRVYGFHFGENSRPSDSLSITIGAAPTEPLEPQANVVRRPVRFGDVDTGANITYHGLPVTWAATGPYTTFEVEMSLSSTFETIIASTNTVGSEFRGTELAGGEYFLRVRQVNAVDGTATPWSEPLAIFAESRSSDSPGLSLVALVAAIAVAGRLRRQ